MINPTETCKNIFLILGFARSGTSVITRGLKALGIDLGNHLEDQDPSNTWNPTGFFEDKEIIHDIHAAVFTKLGHSARSIQIIHEKEYTQYDLSATRQYAITLLNQRFTKTNYWGFKDPNTAKLLPFWRSIFQTEKIHPHYIIALRNPLASAHSYASLTKVDVEIGLILWLTHLIPAIDETMGEKRIVVSYELMMQNPMQQLARMQSQFNIHAESPDLEHYAKQYINHKLHHHHFNDNDLNTNANLAIAPLCIHVYNILMKVASDEWQLDSPAFLSAWQSLKNEFEKYYPIYAYLDTLLQKNKELSLRVRWMKKSIVWKLFYPIQLIDDKLRQLRVKKRAKRRLQTAYE